MLRIFLTAVAVLLVIASQMLSHETTTTTVLFDREIVGILNQHCVMCHVDKGLSFPLSTYEQTWLRGRPIREAILRRHMPPWFALPGYGRFVNDNSLTLRETQFIVSWVEGLGPRNAGTVFLNVLDSRAARREEIQAQAHFGHWQLGEPGLIRQLAANVIPAKQERDVRRVVVDLGLKTERRLRALEFMPGDRRVVRAAFFMLKETGQWLGSWTPWYGFTILPEGTAYRLPAGSHILAEIHYQGTAEPVTEQGSLGLFFSDRPVSNVVRDLAVEARGMVPPGATAQRFRAETRVSANTFILALRPHIVPGLKSIEVSARKPDGGTEILLFAKDPSPDWPTPYIFKDPIRLSTGTVVSATVYYANPSSAPQTGGVRLTISRY
jgi:hypothetical protein